MSTVTAGVFQDVTWARRGVAALIADGFVPASLTLLARDTAEAAALMIDTIGGPPERIDVPRLGVVIAFGPLLALLRGADDGLSVSGLAATLKRAGFQGHDGHIFETLVGRGGVLAAVTHEARAADALARFHAYGGGNAAIGAWTGRV